MTKRKTDLENSYHCTRQNKILHYKNNGAEGIPDDESFEGEKGSPMILNDVSEKEKLGEIRVR
jgi:hypothetical protein